MHRTLKRTTSFLNGRLRHETTDRFQELSFQHLVVRHRRGYDFGALSCAQLKLEVKAACCSLSSGTRVGEDGMG